MIKMWKNPFWNFGLIMSFILKTGKNILKKKKTKLSDKLEILYKNMKEKYII